VNELHQELDQALRALPVSDAPVERVKRDGRRLRSRRRSGIAAGVIAVIAVAVGAPALAGNLTEHKVTPADSRPVPITDTPPAGTTHATGGLATSSGVIAQGKVGATPWYLRATSQKNKSVDVDFCTSTVRSSENADVASGKCVPFENLSAGLLDASEPASMISAGSSEDGSIYYQFLAVAKDVPYLVVTFTDGQQLKLIPVIAGGHRYAVWAAPLSTTVASVTAHLGSPYSDNGQTETAIPFTQPGQEPDIGLWQKPGQPGPARVHKTIGRGNKDGQAWTADAYQGPWGTCIQTSTGESDCLPTATYDHTGVLGYVGNSSAGVTFGAAKAGVTMVRVSLSDGSSAEAKPATVGANHWFAIWTGKNLTPVSWTSYNAAGQQVGQGKV
jgi:hypothetical protein